MKNKTIGILDNGNNNTFTNNKFVNIDVGIQEEGEFAFAHNNEFVSNNKNAKGTTKWWVEKIVIPLIIGGIIGISTLYIGYYLGWN